ncbi:MAG: hypothetical protein ACPGGB_10610, partial [Flavobacteriales bacterium]
AVAIRYDVNPCDGRVVAERLRGEKLPEDDVASMLEGLSGWKGRVRLAETRPLTFDGMVGKEGWAEAALGVDAALEVLPIQGAWADAAKKGLSEGAEIADPGLASRVADIGAHVNAILPGMSDADIRECALEFYRESV